MLTVDVIARCSSHHCSPHRPCSAGWKSQTRSKCTGIKPPRSRHDHLEITRSYVMSAAQAVQVVVGLPLITRWRASTYDTCKWPSSRCAKSSASVTGGIFSRGAHQGRAASVTARRVRRNRRPEVGVPPAIASDRRHTSPSSVLRASAHRRWPLGSSRRRCPRGRT